MRTVKMLSRLVMAVVVLLLLAVVAVRVLNPPLPSTAELRAYLAAHRDVLDTHRSRIEVAVTRGDQPVRHDGEGSGYAFWMRASPPLEGLIFITHTRGVGVGVFGTGVARLAAPPDRLYADLESMREDARGMEGFIGFTDFGDGWYGLLWEAD